jgi:hypothetical protein
MLFFHVQSGIYVHVSAYLHLSSLQMLAQLRLLPTYEPYMPQLHLQQEKHLSQLAKHERSSTNNHIIDNGKHEAILPAAAEHRTVTET